jgi:hypothetical protein
VLVEMAIGHCDGRDGNQLLCFYCFGRGSNELMLAEVAISCFEGKVIIS